MERLPGQGLARFWYKENGFGRFLKAGCGAPLLSTSVLARNLSLAVLPLTLSSFEISPSTEWRRTKSKYGGLEVSEARRLKSLEDEKRRLKKQSLGSSAPTIKYFSAVELPQIAAGVAEDR
ncbi:MAG: hypothetical protein WA571_17990, partial [Candidatus Binatus sp.]